MQVTRVLETALYVDDLDRARDFYQQVLGAELYSQQSGRHVFFRVGEQMLLLFSAAACREQSSDVPFHGAEGPGHIAFAAVDHELPRWEQQLSRHEVSIEQRVEWPGGGRSLYFRDPAGNSLELATPSLWT